jgi:hypothetical protein|tara:strand:+ start:4030 stop:4149 length:120 start_codon:yes stop_codon:yes gene_type:complete
MAIYSSNIGNEFRTPVTERRMHNMSAPKRKLRKKKKKKK